MRHVLGSSLLLLAITFGAAVRIEAALTADNFDTESAVGMLRSDPGLLYYLTERVLGADGGIPDDFRADPRIEYPELTDIPATFTVGQEFVVAWCSLWFGEDMPLHVLCVWVMAIIASLTVVGVYGLTLELTGKVRWACAAAAFFVLLPANYRTIGFILVREDFSLPWFALHLWWMARAARLRTVPAFAMAVLFGVTAAATWHASGFLVAMGVACVFLWALRSGQNPMRDRGALAALGVGVLGGLIVPVLRAKGFFLSLPVQMLLALGATVLWQRWRPQARWPAWAVATAAFAAIAGASFALSLWSGGGGRDFAHVFELMWSKIVWLGQLPADPERLGFDVRLMWQGPFQSLAPTELHALLTVGFWLSLPAIAIGGAAWRRGDGDGRIAVLAAFTAIAVLIALLVQRLQNVPGILCAVAAALTLSRVRNPRLAVGALVIGLAIQGLVFAHHIRTLRLVWYDPPEQRLELASLVRWLPKVVPPSEAVAADFVNSTAILAHLEHPIMAQPKWETAASRRRAEDLLLTFNRGTASQLRRMLLDKYQCSYLVVDRRTMWGLGRYSSGYPVSQLLPPPGTAASVFCSDDLAVLTSVPGFRLLYRSPAEIRGADGLPSDWFRIYYLEP